MKTRQHAEKQRHYYVDKGPYSQGCGLPSGHVRLWELLCKKGGVPKNWCLQTVVLKKTPESPSDSKEIKWANPKGDQPWLFTGRTDAQATLFGSSDVNSWLIGKVPDAGKDWGRRRGCQRRRWQDGITKAIDMNLGKLRKMLRDRGLACCLRGVTESWTQLGNWTTAKTTYEVTGFLFAQARLSRNSCYLPTKVSQLITPKNPH